MNAQYYYVCIINLGLRIHELTTCRAKDTHTHTHIIVIRNSNENIFLAVFLWGGVLRFLQIFFFCRIKMA